MEEKIIKLLSGASSLSACLFWMVSPVLGFSCFWRKLLFLLLLRMALIEEVIVGWRDDTLLAFFW